MLKIKLYINFDAYNVMWMGVIVYLLIRNCVWKKHPNKDWDKNHHVCCIL